MTGGECCQLCAVNIFSLSLACFSILVASLDEKIRLTLLKSNLSFVFVLYILWVLVSNSLPTTKSRSILKKPYTFNFYVLVYDALKVDFCV